MSDQQSDLHSDTSGGEADLPTGQPLTPRAERDLKQAMGASVLEVDAVVRLEPTMRNQLRRLSRQSANLLRRGSAEEPVPDGIELRVEDGRVLATVEVAVRPIRPAAEIAEQIQDQLRAVIMEHQHEPGTISVAVLAVERNN